MIRTFPGAFWGNTPAFSHDGGFLAALGSKNEVIIWNTETGELVLSPPQLRAFLGPFVLGFSPDDRWLFVRAIAFAASVHITCVWDMRTG